MKRFLMAAAPLALLGACSGGGGGESDGLQPGEWTMTSQIDEITLAGMPEEMVAQMREQANAQPPNINCLTEEDVENPVEGMFSNSEMGEECDFGDSAFEDGVINVNATCQGAEGEGIATLTVQGTYTATTMAAELSLNVEGGPSEMSMSSTLSAERTGECEAEPVAAAADSEE
jgi:Protein of unknown function (DUF3617)